jgi:hypothetical protein
MLYRKGSVLDASACLYLYLVIKTVILYCKGSVLDASACLYLYLYLIIKRQNLSPLIFFVRPSPNYLASLFFVWNWKTTTQHHSS